jgi:hypothetical protein
MVNRNKFVVVCFQRFSSFTPWLGAFSEGQRTRGIILQLSVSHEVLSKIRNSYWKIPISAEVMNGALRGLLESLDSYSHLSFS